MRARTTPNPFRSHRMDQEWDLEAQLIDVLPYPFRL